MLLDLGVERPRPQLLQHRLVLRLHQLLHLAVLVCRGVVDALGGEDGAAEEQVREDVGVLQAGVFGLHVVQAAGVPDVVVVTEERGARLHRRSSRLE